MTGDKGYEASPRKNPRDEQKQMLKASRILSGGFSKDKIRQARARLVMEKPEAEDISVLKALGLWHK